MWWFRNGWTTGTAVPVLSGLGSSRCWRIYGGARWTVWSSRICLGSGVSTLIRDAILSGCSRLLGCALLRWMTIMTVWEGTGRGTRFWFLLRTWSMTLTAGIFRWRSGAIWKWSGGTGSLSALLRLMAIRRTGRTITGLWLILMRRGWCRIFSVWSCTAWARMPLPESWTGTAFFLRWSIRTAWESISGRCLGRRRHPGGARWRWGVSWKMRSISGI